MPSPPEFGIRRDDVLYRDRPDAYAVLISDEGRIALIEAGKNRFFLPGGGLKSNESAEDALAREVVDYRARGVRRVAALAENRIRWMGRDEAIAALARESDAWALRQEVARSESDR